MEWDNDKCLELIHMYELKPEIWQASHNLYYNKNRKQAAWSEIAKDMETTIDVVKSKLNSLLSSFRREKSKQAQSMGPGKGRDEVYRSKWSGFPAFKFLMNKKVCQKTLNAAQTKINLREQTVKDEVSQIDSELEQATEDETSGDSEDASSSNKQNATRESIDIQETGQPNLRPQTRKRKLETPTNPRTNQTWSAPQGCAPRDPCYVYGEYIAMKLRNYSPRTESVVQHLFGNILFNADMGKYDKNGHSD